MNRCALIIGCILLTLAAPLSLAAADAEDTRNGLPLVYQSTFDSGLEDWRFTDEKAWKIVEEDGNKVLALTAQSKYFPPVRSPINQALLKDLNLSDFVIEVRLKQTGREYGHRDLCLFFNHQDPAHFYYVHLATTADEHANSIFLVNGEPRVSIAKERTDGTKWTSAYHQVKIERDTAAGAIKVYFDDMEKPVMVAEDKHFLSGAIGLGSFDDVGQFDDLKIWGTKVE
ncbi:MAG: hypothetical protein HYV27_09415 [Candidatus Hydrogenedentes bacterium]|nr:hypothetical protein [Candidatus Hydrogenedentota bacterium]